MAGRAANGRLQVVENGSEGRKRRVRTFSNEALVAFWARVADNRQMRPTEEMLASRPDVKAIKDLVLRHGGKDIDVPREWLDHVESIWAIWMSPLHTEGRCLEGDVEERKMEPSQCHKNATTLFLNHQVDLFATGFALDPDRVWYFHSWGIRKADRPVIVETVGQRFDRYFGAVYSGEVGKERAKGLYNAVTDALSNMNP